MTTGRINQVFCFFFVFFLLALFFYFFSFSSILSFLILFFFQNDLLLLFREQISLLLRNVPRFVSFFLSFSVFLSLRQAYDYWQDQPGFLLFCFLSSRSFLFFLFSFSFFFYSSFFLILFFFKNDLLLVFRECSAFRFILFSFFETSI